MNEEGWYQDPYGIHEDRWYSDGTPSKLVRDGETESYDAPPPGVVPSEPFVRSTHAIVQTEPGYVEGNESPDYGQKGGDAVAGTV